MWYKKAFDESVNLEEKAKQKLLEEEDYEKPQFLTDIDDPNEVAQYVSMTISEAVNKYFDETPENKYDFKFLNQIVINHAAQRALKEVGIFMEDLYQDMVPILNESLRMTRDFRGLVDYYVENYGEEKIGYVRNIKQYGWDFWKVFRFIFLKNLTISGIFPPCKLKYSPHYTCWPMREWPEERKERLWEATVPMG